MCDSFRGYFFRLVQHCLVRPGLWNDDDADPRSAGFRFLWQTITPPRSIGSPVDASTTLPLAVRGQAFVANKGSPSAPPFHLRHDMRRRSQPPQLLELSLRSTEVPPNQRLPAPPIVDHNHVPRSRLPERLCSKMTALGSGCWRRPALGEPL